MILILQTMHLRSREDEIGLCVYVFSPRYRNKQNYQQNYKTENFLLSLLSPNLMEDVSLK